MSIETATIDEYYEDHEIHLAAKVDEEDMKDNTNPTGQDSLQFIISKCNEWGGRVGFSTKVNVFLNDEAYLIHRRIQLLVAGHLRELKDDVLKYDIPLPLLRLIIGLYPRPFLLVHIHFSSAILRLLRLTCHGC